MNLLERQPERLEAFREAVAKIVGPARAHVASGTKAGEESLSHLISELRYAGWKVGGDYVDHVDTLKAAGFAIRVNVAGRSVRTYVSKDSE